MRETKYNPLKHHRRSIRLKGYDYSAPGAYFITVCVHNRECALGEIVDGEMRLNEAGEIVVACWQAIPAHFVHVGLDLFVVMPNHLHGIIVLEAYAMGGKGEASAVEQAGISGVLAADASPLRMDGTPPGSIPAIVQNFKSVSSRRLNALRATPGAHFWQRNYYEHIVRNEAGLARIRTYIQNNPARWARDQLHPAAPSNPFNRGQL